MDSNGKEWVESSHSAKFVQLCVLSNPNLPESSFIYDEGSKTQYALDFLKLFCKSALQSMGATYKSGNYNIQFSVQYMTIPILYVANSYSTDFNDLQFWNHLQKLHAVKHDHMIELGVKLNIIHPEYNPVADDWGVDHKKPHIYYNVLIINHDVSEANRYMLVFEIEGCNCCDCVGTVVQSKKNRRKVRRKPFCYGFVSNTGNCNSNGVCNCNGDRNGNLRTVTGYPLIGKPCQTNSQLCDYLKQDFPQIHVSRRLSSQSAIDPCHVNTIHEVSLDISESEEKKRQMKDQDSNSALTRFEQSVGGHVPVRDDEDVDDDACLPPRSVFPISFDCLDSQMS